MKKAIRLVIIILIVILMEIIAFHMNQKTVVVTVTTHIHTRISLLPMFVEETVGEGVRPRQHYIWSQAIRPPVNNQLPLTEKRYPTKRCRICYKKGVCGETRYFCKRCAVPLHTAKCFEAYHSNKHYYDQE